MICIAESKRDFSSEIESLSRANPFGCRILSLYNTYDFNLPFADFWVQFIDGEPVSLISRIDSSFIVRTTENSDIYELSSFLRVSGASVILCDGCVEINCNMKVRSGAVLYNDSLLDIEEEHRVVVPEIKGFYSIIEKSASESFIPPSYESFMLDVGNRLNKGTARLLGVKEDSLCACVMTLAESSDSAVIGALATALEYRKKGYGRFLMQYLNNALVSEGKTVFLHRAKNENIEFYNKLGFKEYGSWTEYYE